MGKSKNIWKTVTYLPGQEKESKIDAVELDHGSELREGNEIANAYNNFFVNVGDNIASKIVRPMVPPNSNEKQFAHSFYLSPVNPDEIIKNIMELKGNKLPGIDSIKAATFKEIKEYIDEPLSPISNNIYAIGVVPTEFKKPVVIPIFKNGNPKHFKNYRPISVINTISKIFEKCVKSRLNNYLNKYEIIYSRQFGFRKNYSTKDTVPKIVYKM